MKTSVFCWNLRDTLHSAFFHVLPLWATLRYLLISAIYYRLLAINEEPKRKRSVCEDLFIPGELNMAISYQQWDCCSPRYGVVLVRWRQLTTDQRLIDMLNQVDKNRYRLKESKLAKAYIDALGLGRDSEDAYELLKWKLPSSSKYSVSYRQWERLLWAHVSQWTSRVLWLS